MKVEYINPFIESIHNLFTTMLDSKLSRGEIGINKPAGNGGPRLITALIGLSGPARGTVALSFPVKTALALAGHLVGSKLTVVDDTVSDAVAELVNIVAGRAKADFSDHEIPVNLSLPTVIRGDSYNVECPSNATWLSVPFTSDMGPFSLRVTFEVDSEGKGGNDR